MDETKELEEMVFIEEDHSTIYTAEEMKRFGFVRINHTDPSLGELGAQNADPMFVRNGYAGLVYVFADHTDKAGHPGEGYVFLTKREANFSSIVYTENGKVRIF